MFFNVLKTTNPKGFSDDDFKFKNSDVKLDDVVQKNGGHFIMSNADLLFDTPPKRANNG